MKKSSAINVIHWIEVHWQWVLLPLLAFSTGLWLLALGVAWHNLEREWHNLARAVFYTLQFIVLNKEVDYVALKNEPLSLVIGLTVAQFAIPLVASVAFFCTLFREQISPFWIKRTIGRLDGHHVVIGHGAIGQALSLSLSKNQKNVVVVDILVNAQSDSPYIFHLQCDALSPALFDSANLGKAERIYIVLPDERKNLSILDAVAMKNLPADVTVYVRAETSNLQRLFADSLWLKGWMTEKNLDVRPINPYSVAARGIVNEYSPDLYAPTDRIGDIAQTIMIVGVSEMAKALLLRFARIGIYSPKGKLRLIWAGKGVSDALAEMVDHYPSLNPSAHPTQFWTQNPNVSTDFLKLAVTPLDIVTNDQPASQALRDGMIDVQQMPSVVYVCHNSDVQNAIDSRDLQAALSSCLQVSRNTSSMQKHILVVQNHAAIGIGQPENIVPYGVLAYSIEEVCIDRLFADTVVNDRADELAKKFDAAWSKRECVDTLKWNSTSFFLKETNRDPADHAAIKARYAGVDAATVKNCFIDALSPMGIDKKRLLDECREELAFMEMRRYRAFMFLHGFSHGPSSFDDTELMNTVERRFLSLQSTTLTPDELTKKRKNWAKDLDRSLRRNETLLDDHLSSAQKSKDDDIIDITQKALDMKVMS